MTPEEIAAAAAKTEADAAVITKLEEQIDNLNKGIATTRGEAKTAIEAAKAATDALTSFKNESAKKNDSDEPDLTDEEQKKFDKWAKANKIVTQTELESERNARAGESAKETANTAVSEFLAKHPEYDEDDEWEKVQAEFNLYKTPTNLPGYRKLLERVHADLNPDAKTDRAKAQVRAEINKKNTLAKGGGSQGNTSTDAEFEADVDKMQTKYPNLSREQIEARLTEVRELYSEKKK